jgi:hypothetical protein
MKGWNRLGQLTEGVVMRPIVPVSLAGVVAAFVLAAPAPATIHPIMLGWVCGSFEGDPPGQTPGENHWDVSTFRALQATGVLTITASGPVLDLSQPASKFTTFDVVTETGTSDSPAAANCTNATP